MNKPLKKTINRRFHIKDGVRIEGLHDAILGNVSGLRGNVSDLRGDVSGLSGDVTGLRGNVTGLSGDVSGIPFSSRPCDIAGWTE